MTTKNLKSRMGACRNFGVSLLAAAVLVTGVTCSTDITNPGGAQDAYLDSLDAHTALVVGTRRSLALAMQNIIYWGAAMVFEINPAGSTGSYGIESYIQAGEFRNNLTGDWNATQEARWTAEDAVDRFRRVLESMPDGPDFNSYAPAAQALVWAGFANRLLGENFCQATFNGGGLLPHTAAFQRADSLFQQAISIGTAAGETDYVSAARAGRASVLASLATYGLADWDDAAAEAALVPDNFVWTVPYSNQALEQYNFLYWANASTPYRAHTVWGTYWENNPDPRTPWRIAPDTTGDAGVEKFGGNVPWYPEEKDTATDDPINVASGWEMRLIRAEAALAGNDLTEAANQMNVRRANLGLALYPVPFASLADGYTALKYERAAELWLEARRMGDIRRWMDNNTPGAYIDGNYRDFNQVNQYPNKVEDLSGRDRAYLVGLSEVETNPNFGPNDIASCSPGG
ncbi:MAG: RagB/SusD family nutrient uptake outer membrane protein [Gemmatimonadota bacterium]|nr:MAG: RagB/SusD family nutrient uptake outer membrane protein [Gemmatimonadota bacterium]